MKSCRVLLAPHARYATAASPIITVDAHVDHPDLGGGVLLELLVGVRGGGGEGAGGAHGLRVEPPRPPVATEVWNLQKVCVKQGVARFALKKYLWDSGIKMKSRYLLKMAYINEMFK